MPPEVSPVPPTYRVLLIGIDDYPYQDGRCRLRGCVSDIDAVEDLLVKQVGIPPTQVVRLASPLADFPTRSSLPAKPATLENIRTSLADLAKVTQKGDRVFV